METLIFCLRKLENRRKEAKNSKIPFGGFLVPGISYASIQECTTLQSNAMAFDWRVKKNRRLKRSVTPRFRKKDSTA